MVAHLNICIYNVLCKETNDKHVKSRIVYTTMYYGRNDCLFCDFSYLNFVIKLVVPQNKPDLFKYYVP